MDLTEVFLRDSTLDDAAVTAAREAAERWLSTDVVCVFHALSDEPRQGIDGWRDAWLDWLAPWDSYRAEIEEVRDLGDRVAVFVRDYGRPRGMTEEVEFRGVAIYTVRERKIVRIEHFTERSQAAAALGARD
jgi:ketosteroid isomerase-like protein